MITFVYYCLNVLILFCHCVIIEPKEYLYDSPPIIAEDILSRQDNKEVISRYKEGSDIVLKCNGPHIQPQHINWEFKNCTTLKDIECGNANPYDFREDDNGWIKLDYNRGRRKLEIKNSDKNDIGLYRCISDNKVIKIFIVEVVTAPYNGPPPKVLSVVSTNYTKQSNQQITLVCNTTSVIAAKISWMKECDGKRCDIQKNESCYCFIPIDSPVHSTGNNIYISKLSLINTSKMDSGIYVCLVYSLYGKDYEKIILDIQGDNDSNSNNNYSLLFLIPFAFISIPITVWLCYFRRKRKCTIKIPNEHQKKLIKPVVKVNILLEPNRVV